ncbi:sigma 54-interacting transcriptional regulator [Desmospora activa]|uniref:Transcriptional regulatory protein LevR n=1 Tax=Desmospora activa DSM 45169 TaxID=1121389 RepID=A0A2T4Z7M0_9BACL|nr:sigma-54-dependent transcriptional regulator [Desmospora activa]PTM57887.1 transcriptional regulatory protein LevR [Desmospora activa DSM 45169]
MKRIDLIYEELKALTAEKGVSAVELAKRLQLDRTNVSRDLNQLWKAGKIQKSSGRPVLFSVKDQNEKQTDAKTILDQFAQENQSLVTAIEQGKAAILYPPRGMHVLLIGETGTGKSMFAKLLHTYGVETGILEEGAPFVTFNCADYAHNPQLLLGQLFGVKKGAYTGAMEQKGLLHQADQGILLLDEIHRLPAEGQEMLFTFIDQGLFRRLGETETEQRADVMILCATTENPESSLLQTFRRRIPMTIHLPPLRERSCQDRHHLVFRFFKEEAIRLGKAIYISSNTLRALLHYPCPHNIGQLKTDIQLLCARAYADYVTMKKEKIQINSSDLARESKEGLFIAKRKPDTLIHRYYIFHPDRETLLFEPEEIDHNNIYENIEKKYNELKVRGIADDELELLMEIDIDNYFTQYIQGVHRRIDSDDLGKIIDPERIDLAEQIIQTAETQLEKAFPRKVVLGMALHLHTLINRVKSGKKIVNPQLNKIRTTYKQEFSVAWDCMKMIEEKWQLDLPIDEAGYLTMFLVLDDRLPDDHDQVAVMVLMHGSGCATAMADVTNQLLGTNHAKAIDMPLQLEPMKVYERVKRFAQNTGPHNGLLLLVDMGSLLTFAEMLEKEMEIPVKGIAAASTPHVLEATRKAMLGYTLDQIYEDVTHLAPLYSTDTVNRDEQEHTRPLAILTACLTGKGSALAIKKVLENYLRFKEEMVHIVPIDIGDSKEVDAVLAQLKRNYRLLCVISHFTIAADIPQFHIEDVLSLQAIYRIQEMIDTEETYIKMGEALQNHLINIKAEQLVADVRHSIANIERQLEREINSYELMGVVLHISCMVDRLMSGQPATAYQEKERLIRAYPQLYQVIKLSLHPLEQTYGITIKDDEVCYIINFFQQTETLL